MPSTIRAVEDCGDAMAIDKRRALIFGAVAAGAAAAGLLGGPLLLERATPDGNWLRDAVFEDLSGKTHRLSEWRVNLLALNFWATWCAPCRDEIPVLMRAREKHLPRGLEVVGIALDLAANVAAYLQSLPISYPVLLAAHGGMDLMRKLGNPGGVLPYTAFVGPDGEVLGRKLGAFRPAELDEALARLLG